MLPDDEEDIEIDLDDSDQPTLVPEARTVRVDLQKILPPLAPELTPEHPTSPASRSAERLLEEERKRAEREDPKKQKPDDPPDRF